MTSPTSTPVVLVTGIDPEPMADLLLGLQVDLPGAVAVQHDIDVENAVLTRTVSDVTGLLEREHVDLEHLCVSCAIREDVIPTLRRLAELDRWTSIVSRLPVSAPADQVCTVLAVEPDGLIVSAVVTAVSASGAEDALLGDDLLAERGLHTAPADRRGVGEALADLVEHADVVVLDGPAPGQTEGLVRTLARPDVVLLGATTELTSSDVSGRHVHRRTRAWTDPTRTTRLPRPLPDGVWQADLRSKRAFHPDRLREGLAALGEGRHRSRGCFWLPTRPDHVLRWDGAGGQLSVGTGAAWTDAPFTRIVLTGTGTAPAHLEDAFDDLLVAPEEHVDPAPYDGFEPWLGPIRPAT